MILLIPIQPSPILATHLSELQIGQLEVSRHQMAVLVGGVRREALFEHVLRDIGRVTQKTLGLRGEVAGVVVPQAGLAEPVALAHAAAELEGGVRHVRLHSQPEFEDARATLAERWSWLFHF